MKDQVNLLMKADLNDYVGYNSEKASFSIGGSLLNSNYWDSCWHQWYPTYPTYITNTVYQQNPNAFELAFKIVTKMLETKVIEKLTVKQLIETVNEVAKLV